MRLHHGKIRIPVLFENDFCIVLDKPTGLPVQGGEGIKVSLDSILSEKIHPRPLLVHRLDRDTSGIILVAKTKEAAAGFSALFAGTQGAGTGKVKKERTVIKQYLGVCSGIPEPEQGVIRLALDGRGQTKNLKESETSYRFIFAGTVSELPFSLLELELGTGRMHQIRRHLAQIGHPLLGDDKYGDFPLNKQLRKSTGLKHLLLHASKLILPPSPCLPGGLSIEAQLPEYYVSFLK